ncbi:hypothetical protein [Variovorax sp. E3]|uniref:hypothetical protein n=1 Tax=Variovorax sp. E3 TaxID=1914993 RepID=UPI0022B6AAF0|nr:hypothetical protein [Variovorax sp. E3]
MRFRPNDWAFFLKKLHAPEAGIFRFHTLETLYLFSREKSFKINSLRHILEVLRLKMEVLQAAMEWIQDDPENGQGALAVDTVT